MGGFTQDDGYVRGVAADAQRFTGSLLDLLLDVPATFFENLILLIAKSLVPIRVHVLHYPPLSHANSFVLGPAVIKHTLYPAPQAHKTRRLVRASVAL